MGKTQKGDHLKSACRKPMQGIQNPCLWLSKVLKNSSSQNWCSSFYLKRRSAVVTSELYVSSQLADGSHLGFFHISLAYCLCSNKAMIIEYSQKNDSSTRCGRILKKIRR